MMGMFSSTSYQENPSFSMFFPSENDDVFDHKDDPYSSVDCTLSLGTPSTRLITEEDHHKRRFSSSSTPAFGPDLLHGRNSKTASHMPQHSHRSNGRGGDPGLARRCANCDTTTTPLWRNGPRGPKSLCNACGIRFKKEERRATAGKATSGGVSSEAAAAVGGVPMSDHQMYNTGSNYNYNQYYDSSSSSSTWHHHATQGVPCSYYSPAANDHIFVEDIRDCDSDATAAASFLPWRLDVADQLY
ncbi:PREDICTED: GATA transcription factor 19-like [Tarenaya hassleriana]|uniref:GATA transcription factor 19-like n=1 Tax=Tarenaya hassleriana TaxID=28532 RepID=UPI00053C6DD8|nr:PREDICTED: GATA transcription factor 19-like [Tarenaya hassleriana]